MNKAFFAILFLVFMFGASIKMQAQDLLQYNKAEVKNHKSNDYFSGGSNDEDNTIKINILSAIFLGELPIYYERVLNNHFSIEAGIGPTYYSLDALDPALYPMATNQQAENDLSQYSTSQMGLTAKLSFRYFPAGEAPEGLYLAPEIRYKKYNSQISGFPVMNYNDTAIITNLYNRSMSYLDIVGVLGYNIISDNGYYSGSYDVYVGFGIRFRKYDAASEVIDPTTGGTDLFFTPKSDAIPYFTIGVKYGLVLE